MILISLDENPASAAVPLVPRVKPNDKWEGEDEDEDVKDNWDDEEEEEKPSKETQDVTAPASKPSTGGGKKRLAKRIAEKEAKLREKQETKLNSMTPDEILADKLARQRLQEESDFRLAVESLGISSPASGGTLDLNQLASKEDFDSFRKNLVEKLVPVEKSPHYVSFLETLCRELCASLDPEDIKRISSALSILSNEKIKASKGTKKKPKKGAAIKVDWQETAYGDMSDDEYADFM